MKMQQYVSQDPLPSLSLGLLSGNMAAVIVERRERFHQDISMKEKDIKEK